MSYRSDNGFGAATAFALDSSFGNPDKVSFDFGVNSVFEKPAFRSKPRISFIRPPVGFAFDDSSLNGILTGVGIVGSFVLIYLLGKRFKWW